MDYEIRNPIYTTNTSFRAGIRDIVIKNAIRNKEPLLVWFRDGDKIKISYVNKPKIIINKGELEKMYRKYDEPMNIYHYSFIISDIWDLDRWNMRKIL